MRSLVRAGAACGAALVGLALLLPTSATAQESIACRNGLKLRLSSQNPVQGSLVLLQVDSPRALAELKAAAPDLELPFWRTGNPRHSYRTLLGVDLEEPAGLLPLTVSAELETGERLACSVLVNVREGEFITEHLQVPRKFVELNPKDLRRARRESERLREIFASATPERLWGAGFRSPLGDVEGSGNFGRRRILNNQPRSPHSGEDYPAEAGTPVRAPARGRVVLADELFFSGNTVVLDHGLGLYTFYGHLQSLAVEEGRLVDPGTVLGRVGATGRVTGAHLHWAARLNRARIDPRDLVEVLSGADE